jgi:hypothetical protein
MMKDGPSIGEAAEGSPGIHQSPETRRGMHDRKHNLNTNESRARVQDHAAAPHDRKHGVDADDPSGAALGDSAAARRLSLAARSLGARGDAPDGSEDGRAGEGPADARGDEA